MGWGGGRSHTPGGPLTGGGWWRSSLNTGRRWVQLVGWGGGVGATHLEVPSREGLVEELAEHREEVGTVSGVG